MVIFVGYSQKGKLKLLPVRVLLIVFSINDNLFVLVCLLSTPFVSQVILRLLHVISASGLSGVILINEKQKMKKGICKNQS